MVNFDWYRKIMARGFKLRSGAHDTEDVVESDAGELVSYQSWFGESIGAEKFPYIDVKLLDRVQGL
ncbi:hypothetical protein [Oceanicoccus sp. KOV_DT_Chl]|uniref:hypothetical protein n=1 Tax=Oceanicoccus sp. KOV_DT_Chl TaxID=1904639 RepID=UPI000C7976D6|nr:hypothetical protein [Oceanicoccus sp. KOV_DT_Chl]